MVEGFSVGVKKNEITCGCAASAGSATAGAVTAADASDTATPDAASAGTAAIAGMSRKQMKVE